MLKKTFFTILIAVMIFTPLTGYCLPTGQQVAAGSAQVSSPNKTTLNIKQNTDKAILNWATFNIAAGETVNFLQPAASSIALNRIADANASTIYGALNANGRIFMINPNGILFGGGCQVNVGGLLATTLNISNADFLAGKYNFSGTKGNILNQGILNANSPGGFIALLAPTIENQGTIAVASLGTIALAAGEAATISLDSKGLISVALTKPTSTNPSHKDAALKNSGSLKADGGTVILNAQALNQVFNNAINNSGVIQANTLVNQNGTVKLVAVGNVEDAGSITASNLTVDVTGTVNAKGPIKLTKDFTLISGNFISDVAQTFSVGGSFSLSAGTFSRFGHIVIDDKTYDIIYDVYGLQAMQGNLNGQYILGNDIDATPTRNWNWDPEQQIYLGFVPVGSSFNGILDGRDYLVDGLYINRPIGSPQYVGLFVGITEQGQIKNIGLVNCDITGPCDVGILTGYNAGLIFNTYASGSVRQHGRGSAGGLVGFNEGSISTCYANVNVSGYDYLGGLVGYNWIGGTISKCYATGNVEGEWWVGGLVGENYRATISKSYATGNVTGGTGYGIGIGGLAGLNQQNGIISDCYAQGNVRSNGYSGSAGGLVGENWGGSSIFKSYSTGSVTGTGDLGGFVGQVANNYIFSANFWDLTVNPTLHDIGNLGDVEGITAKTTAEMKLRATFVGWDFDHIWQIDEGVSYPYFNFRPVHVVPPPVSVDSIKNPVPEPVNKKKKLGTVSLV